jgi:hypothetical protein
MIAEGKTVVTHGEDRGELVAQLRSLGFSDRVIRDRIRNFRGGRAHVAVTIVDGSNPFELKLYFEHAGRDAPFVRFTVDADAVADELDPAAFARLARNLPAYVKYALAEIAWDQGDADAAVEAVRRAGTSPRGFPDSFYREVATEYRRLVAAGDPHPVKSLTMRWPADKSRASRWKKEAERRGYLEPGEADDA